jgi:hypothetical protein
MAVVFVPRDDELLFLARLVLIKHNGTDGAQGSGLVSVL